MSTSTPVRRRRSLRRRPLALVAVVLSGMLLLTGCDFSVYKMPLPGGADVGSKPMTIKVEFADVLDLVPQSGVRVDDVAVGKVTDVSLDGATAVVTLEVPRDIDLPDDARAEIRQTSLLGEKFVSLETPEGGGTGRLQSGDVIPLARTGRNPEIEEVFGALSLLLNGGGVAQLKTIAAEISKALDGREGTAKSTFRRLRTLVTQLDDGRADIVDAIDSVDRLARTAKSQQKTINAALEDLPSAVRSIDRQRAGLVKLLRSLDKLGTVGTRVIRASKNSTIQSLRLLQPVLRELANAGDDLVNGFQILLTYPFVDASVGTDPQTARNLHMGDYVNLSLQLDLDLANQDIPGLPSEVCIPFDELSDITQLPPLSKLCDNARKRVVRCLNDLKDGKLNSGFCRGLVTGTVEDAVDAVCAALPLGQLPIGLCPTTPSRGTGSGSGSGSGSGDPLGGLLGGLLGRGRAPTGDGAQPVTAAAPGADGLTATWSTIGELGKQFDPDLVRLMTPDLVVQR